jgi:hypothetical protein
MYRMECCFDCDTHKNPGAVAPGPFTPICELPTTNYQLLTAYYSVAFTVTTACVASSLSAMLTTMYAVCAMLNFNAIC